MPRCCCWPRTGISRRCSPPPDSTWLAATTTSPAATAARGLRAIGDDRLRAAELLAVLVDCELSVGDLPAAIAACDDLVAAADRLEVPGLQARIAAVRARVLAAAGDTPAAIATAETALDRLPVTGVPLLRATLLLDLVRLHDQVGNRRRPRRRQGGRQRYWPPSTWCCRPLTLPSSTAWGWPRRWAATAPLGARRPSAGRTAAGWWPALIRGSDSATPKGCAISLSSWPAPASNGTRLIWSTV